MLYVHKHPKCKRQGQIRSIILCAVLLYILCDYKEVGADIQSFISCKPPSIGGGR